ncbi:CPBP family intramembrane glutamic endopeptidase [uncultured Methanobrevibacter sp.]|uniref:CPBP family intramembrane glutamic endopeptidase n=1 Tax=uncultured Methanobrevibacter sp. TaxID=253161 RepID=UPI0026013621|nr:type II CAAX endopeptidase family protein [uncultured Methanobrevibacter sp.]
MNEHKKLFSKIGFNYLLLALLPILFQIILVNIISLWDVNFIKNINNQTVISSLTNYIIILPVFIYLMNKIESTKITETKLGIKKFLIYLCIALTLMWIGNIIGLVITQILGNAITNEIVNPIEELIQNSSIYINLIIISIIAPIFEELFFRKLLIDRTIKYGATLSILLSAFIFALFHGNLNQFFYAFLLGAFFAYVYTKTGKIIYTIILHAFVNFYGSVASTFFNLAKENIVHGITMANIGDITIIILYLTTLVIIWSVGLYTIFTNYKNIEVNDEEREIYLEKPVQTVLLNLGMALFVIYHIFRILVSLSLIKI